MSTEDDINDENQIPLPLGPQFGPNGLSMPSSPQTAAYEDSTSYNHNSNASKTVHTGEKHSTNAHITAYKPQNTNKTRNVMTPNNSTTIASRSNNSPSNATNGVKVRKANSTKRRNSKAQSQSGGVAKELSPEKEKQLLELIRNRYNDRSYMTAQDIIDFANYAVKFNNVQQAKEWFQRFLQRNGGHAMIDYNAGNSIGVNVAVVLDWFHAIQKVMNSTGIVDPELIYTMGEIGFKYQSSDSDGLDALVAPNSASSAIKKYRLSIECIGLNGWMSPAYVALNDNFGINESFKRLIGWKDDWVVRLMGETGWNSTELLLDWFKKFNEWTEPIAKGRWRLLMMKGYSFETMSKLNQIANNHSIYILSVPPHTSHMLIPADNTYFETFKQQFQSALEEVGKPEAMNGKGAFFEILTKARLKPIIKESVLRSWQECGITPTLQVLPDKVLERYKENLVTDEGNGTKYVYSRMRQSRQERIQNLQANEEVNRQHEELRNAYRNLTDNQSFEFLLNKATYYVNAIPADPSLEPHKTGLRNILEMIQKTQNQRIEGIKKITSEALDELGRLRDYNSIQNYI